VQPILPQIQGQVAVHQGGGQLDVCPGAEGGQQRYQQQRACQWR
jgi:hypothetical protein